MCGREDRVGDMIYDGESKKGGVVRRADGFGGFGLFKVLYYSGIALDGDTAGPASYISASLSTVLDLAWE